MPQPQSLIRRIITPGALQQGRATTTSDTLYMCFDSACSMGCGASDKWGSPHNYGGSAYWQSGRLICRPCKPSHTHNIGIREPSLLNTRTHAHIHSHTHNTHTQTHTVSANRSFKHAPVHSLIYSMIRPHAKIQNNPFSIKTRRPSFCFPFTTPK